MNLSVEGAMSVGIGISAISHIYRPLIVALTTKKFREKFPDRYERLERPGFSYNDLVELNDKESLKYIRQTASLEYIIPSAIAILGFLTCFGGFLTGNVEVTLASSLPTLTHAGELFKK